MALRNSSRADVKASSPTTRTKGAVMNPLAPLCWCPWEKASPQGAPGCTCHGGIVPATSKMSPAARWLPVQHFLASASPLLGMGRCQQTHVPAAVRGGLG